MTVVDWMLDWWLASIEVQVDLRTFVDDWGVLFREQNAFGRVWAAMEDFTGQKDLAIDMTKTRLWSTDAEARKAFRQSQVCVTLAARNLGAHQNFSRHSQRRAPEALDAYASGVGFQTLRDVRELGCPDQVESMLGLFATSSDKLPSNGPTAILVTRLQRIGWAIGGQGLVQDRLGTISLLGIAWDELVLRFKLSWGHVLAHELAYRSTFSGLDGVDLPELHLTLKKFSPADQIYLRCHLHGTLFTPNGKAKFIGPGFVPTSLRAVLTFALNSLQLFLFCQRAWSIMGGRWCCLSGRCWQEAKLRFAAWAITAVPGGAGTFDTQLLMGGHVSGLCQSPYREVNSSDACGDLVNQTWSPCQAPWCDCQGVVRGLGRLLQGRPLRRNAPHSDLWKRVQLAVVDNEALISIQKVVSHGSMKCATNPLEDWVYWHNNLADQAAASINLRRPNEFWVAWGAKQHALNFHRKLHAAIQLVLLETSRIAVQAQQLPKPEPVVDLQPDPVLQVPAAWSIPSKLVKRQANSTSDLDAIRAAKTGCPGIFAASKRIEWDPLDGNRNSFDKGTSQLYSSGTVPSCAIAGQGYDDPVVTTANGGLGVTDASACQALCAARHLCSVFTYYSADGGCWLQGSGLKPKPMPGAIAGPRSCEEFSEASDKASWAEEAVAAENAAAEASAGTVGSAVVADVSTLAPTVPEALTTPMPSRFIKAGEALYYAEGMHPRRVHLVRFLSCGGCESACDHYIHAPWSPWSDSDSFWVGRVR
ncbi:unnamed protein product [Cladocopium goreaui]|uniref:Apple domain-containing protein n=1 Tax=Cladocopium goreaui TaxID=2562237 RepID=A0A9P1DWB0_9DINO|nr:unnamed protein product [Cladocopium goreaui]